MGRSRGQVILVAALGIAVTFVALALITNTAIYTENLATRGTVNGQDAVGLEQSVEDGASGLVALANRYNATSHESIVDRFESDVENLDSAIAIEAARDGDRTRITLVNTTNGSRISQDTPGNFTNATVGEDWTLATDVDRTRRFEMNVSSGNLSDTSPFTVVITDGSVDWTAELSPDGAGGVELTVTNDTTSVNCAVSNETAFVDLTEGTIGGESCATPAFGSDVSTPYDIRFENGSNVDGRYVLFVDRRPSAIDDTQYGDGSAVEPALYDATVRVSIQQPDLTYESNVTVAPEESPEGETYGTVP